MLTCHCTVGAGVPVAAACRMTVVPALTAWLAGLVFTAGAMPTVSVAAPLVAGLRLLVKIARYWYWLLDCAAVAVKL